MINLEAFRDICPNPTTCPGTHISGISVDKRGYVWFDDSLSGRVGYLVPTTHQVVVRTLPKSDAHPHDGLATDSQNNVWFTEQNVFLLVMWPANTVK
jgi:streptogramin lyase